MTSKLFISQTGNLKFVYEFEIMFICLSCMVCTCMLSLFSHVQPFGTSWTVACQSPLFMGFLRQEYWSRMPFLSAGDFLTLGSNPCLLHWQAGSLPLSHQGSPQCYTHRGKWPGSAPSISTETVPLPLLLGCTRKVTFCVHIGGVQFRESDRHKNYNFNIGLRKAPGRNYSLER